MDWTPLVSTIAGAAIAFSGTIAADHLRRRDSHHRYSYAGRQQAYSEMVLALGAGLEGLRAVPAVPTDDRHRASRAAISDAGLYAAREKLLMVAPPGVATAAEAAFEALIVVRDAVGTRAELTSAAFHDAYHPFDAQLWRLRLAIRADLGAPRLDLDELRRGRDTCPVCSPPPAAATPTAPASRTPAG